MGIQQKNEALRLRSCPRPLRRRICPAPMWLLLSLEKTDVAEPQKKSDLGESTGNMFAGALLTSGSFTMMASDSFEEEEELGEGEGTGNMFAGALLTSGSFTMMASSAF